MSAVAERTSEVLRGVPAGVTVVAVCKGRTTSSILEAIDAGIHVLGQNYIADARRVAPAAAGRAVMHFIGHLRPHDVRASTLGLFEMMQSVDSLDVAARINRICALTGRRMPVLIEVNSGRESQKLGVPPEAVEILLRQISLLNNLQVVGLMTMGPLLQEAAHYRPYFSETRRLFRYLRDLSIPGVLMQHLSMGTSNSYAVAIEEGATMVRIGAALFDRR